MKPKIREVLDDCITDGLRSGYAQAYKYEDFPCEETIINAMEDHIWLEIDRKFDFERNVCNEVVEGFDHLGKKRNHAEFLKDLDDWAMSDKREWVGLTDEDIEEVFTFPWHCIPFARAIEAKIKEKNA